MSEKNSDYYIKKFTQLRITNFVKPSDYKNKEVILC